MFNENIKINSKCLIGKPLHRTYILILSFFQSHQTAAKNVHEAETFKNLAPWFAGITISWHWSLKIIIWVFFLKEWIKETVKYPKVTHNQLFFFLGSLYDYSRLYHPQSQCHQFLFCPLDRAIYQARAGQQVSPKCHFFMNELLSWRERGRTWLSEEHTAESAAV